MFYQTIAGTLCPLIFSKISLSLGAVGNPGVIGSLLCVFALFGYWGSIPFWWMAGNEYKKHMESWEKAFSERSIKSVSPA